MSNNHLDTYKNLKHTIEKAKYKKQIIASLMDEGNLELARGKTEQYKTEFPQDIDGYSMSAILYYYNAEYTNAESEIEKIIDIFPFKFDLNYNMAIIAFENKDYSKSLKYYYRSYILTDNDGEKEDFLKIIETISHDELLKNELALRILKEEREIFEYSYRFFPTKLDGSTYTNNMILESNGIGHYVSIYDNYMIQRDGIGLENIKGLEQFYKTEILMSKYIKNIDLNLKEKHLIPICIIDGVSETKLSIENTCYDLSRNIPNRFYYYPVNEGSVKINSKNNIVLGDLIEIKKDPEKADLVLNMFIDGLSQSLIEEMGLEDLMPNTYQYFSKGAVCNNAYVTGEWTYVNMASFYTGDYITNHGMFHPDFNMTLKDNKLIMGELFKRDGYYTAKIDGDWRSVPNYGYIRGIDRFVYQSAVRGMNLEEVITETIEHIEAFKEVNKFLWICISDLHDIADGYEGSLITQINNPIKTRFKELKDDNTSVQRRYDENKKVKYITQIKKLDLYLGLLFNYLEKNYSDEQIVVSLISDHGQGYLVPPDKAFLSNERIKVPFMFRGKNIKPGICDELIEGVDLLPILINTAGIEDINANDRDANLPQYFGGMKGREYTYTESIFPGSTYKVAINDKEHEFIFETEGLVGVDGRFELGECRYYLVNKSSGKIVTDNYLERTNLYLDVVFRHIEKHIIY